MITSSRILLGTIVAFVIVVLGLAAGFQIKQKMDSPLSSPVTRETLKADSPANHNTYEISPPSRGVMLDTFPVEIAPLGKVATVILPSRDAAEIKTGQKVFLYREDGILLDALGEVIEIKKQNSDSITVHIDLSHNPEIPADKIAKGKIIINREKDVPRLPYSALIRNEKAETFIWEVTENSDGTHTAYYKRANVSGGNDVVFAINQGMASSNLFILNPDGALRDGQKINVRQYMYKPPSQNEDLRIIALVNRRHAELKSAAIGQKNLNRRAPNMGSVTIGTGTPQMGTGSGTTPMGPGCPQPPPASQVFIDKIKALSVQDADKAAAAPSP